MKFLLFIIIVCFIGAVVLSGISSIAGWLKRKLDERDAEEAVWEIDEETDEQSTQVVLKRNDQRLLIGAPVPISLPHWEHQDVLAERRVEAEAKAEDLNNRKK